VVHDGLDRDFPPLSTLDLRPNNLPVQVSEFFGREAELDSLLATMGQPSVRLVTLTGPGGTGKTRLGLQAAAESLDRYADGVFFVDLSAERDPESSYEAMVRDLGLVGSREGGPLQILKSKLRERRMLLVLDNLEQVTEAAIGLVELLQHCPGLEMIVTSREALRVRGEHIFPVPPLGIPDERAPLSVIAASDAVRLFTARARSARPDFELTEANAAAIAEISVRLDGLPLALELAAARLGLFTPADLLDRLRGRGDVLGSGPRDLPDRQRTLRGTIEWSYELLDPDECRVFELLSVFSSARLDAVEAVTGAVHPEVDVLESLASLVDKSLVRSVEGETSRRFAMLQTIRDYASERLRADGEVEHEVALAHAGYFADYAADLGRVLEGPDRAAALEDLTSEIGNLRAAWRFWVDGADLAHLNLLLDGLWTLHDVRGWYNGVVELTSDLLDVLMTTEPSPVRDQEEMTLRTSLARALMATRGYTVEVEEEYSKALDLASTTGDAGQRFPVLRALATYYVNLGDFVRTAEMGRQILALAERENDRAMEVEGHVVFGAGATFTGDVMNGLDHFDRAIELFDPKAHAVARLHLGISPGVVARTTSALLLSQGGFPEQARRRANDAVEVARSLDHPYSVAYALWHTGFLELSLSTFTAAHQRGKELEQVASDNDYPVWVALASVLQGVCLCGMGHGDDGLALTDAGLDLYQGLTTPPVFWPQLLAVRASAFAMTGRPEPGLGLIDQAIALSGDVEIGFPEFRILRGDLLTLLPDPHLAEAEEAYRSAIRGSNAIGARLVELAARAHLVDLLRAQGRSPDQSDQLRDLYDTFTEGFGEPDLVAARRVLGGE
jgi:predicted ATPase